MKTLLVTGGARGLGRATAERLAVAGHRVLLTARDEAAGARAVAEIRRAAPSAAVEALPLDLASFASVRALGAALAARRAARRDPPQRRRDAAEPGAARDRRRRRGDARRERARALPPRVRRAAAPRARGAPRLGELAAPPAGEPRRAGRFLQTAPRSPSDPRGRFRFDDPELRAGYDPERAYKNSKLAMLWLAFELARRSPPEALTSNGVCPGFVPTTAAASSTSALQRLLLRHVLPRFPFARTVDEAAGSFAFMLLDPSLEGVTGRFYGERRAIEASADARDPDQAARFLRFAEARTGARWQHDDVVPSP